MCGILAVFGLSDGSAKSRAEVLRLSKLLRHRGPDWNGLHLVKNGILAHERLAINGLHSGAQPILSRAGDVSLAVNGEIYNDADLKARLAAGAMPALEDELTTDSDCEVLLHLYRAHGADFLRDEYVNGMYAFVVYDESEDEYVVARDPVGIIPLYMGWGADGSVWFASEMKALQDHCDHFEAFPPGHYYVGRSVRPSKKNQMKRFYTPRW